MQLTVRQRTAVIIENAISYLCIDVPEDGMVICGRGRHGRARC